VRGEQHSGHTSANIELLTTIGARLTNLMPALKYLDLRLSSTRGWDQ